VYSLALQRAAEKEFGLPEWKPFRERRVWGESTTFFNQHEGALRSFLRAQYEVTQKHLKDKGITSVFGFRGMTESDALRELLASGDKARIGIRAAKLQPMSSFSARLSVAEAFAEEYGSQPGSTMLFGEIPASRVLSLCRTGFGCLHEYEFVVLSSPGKFWEYSWKDGIDGPNHAKLKAILARLK
jgi:hypothetical protein